MNETLVYSLVMVSAVFVAACSQVLLKRAANKAYKNKLSEYINWRVLTAYGLFALSAMINMYVLRYIPLSLAPILESIGYVFVAVMGVVFLQEKLNKTQLFGMLLIIIGVVVFGSHL